jgi:hypothetical protein
MTTRSSRLAPTLRRAVLIMTIGLVALPARAADPVLMFFLGFAKNLIESSIEANAKQRKPAAILSAPAPLARELPAKPAASMTPEDIRTLVDDSFAYLDWQQRGELLAGLEKALADPANASQRDLMLEQFVGVARQVGFTHRQLQGLSGGEKHALARLFAANYQTLPGDQQQELLQQLRQRALPLPSDLNEMMLTALAATQ